MLIFQAAVAGAGATGGEIAQAVASGGIPVLLQDADQAAVEVGLAQAKEATEHQLAGLVKREKLTAEQADAELGEILGRITTTTGLEAFGGADIAIVTGVEDLEHAQDLLAELDAHMPGHAVLACDTSALSITELADATGRPDKVVGLHFFAPASRKRLVEVVEGDESSTEAIHTTLSFAQTIRKTPIRCADAPGLVVDRILAAARGEAAQDDDRIELRTFVEACAVVDEGIATTRDVDLGMIAGAGVNPPPFAGADREGLDTLLARLERAAEAWGDDFAPPPLLRRLVAQGRTGAAAAQGFFPFPRPDAGWDEGPVKLETRGEVAIAWLDNPPANSLSPATVAALRRAWDHVDADPGVRALVIASANPQLFCAGADIREFAKMDATACRALLDETHALLRTFERSRTATVAAVNALALGGGCELAMACDVRVGAYSATFGQPEVDLGIIPGFGGTQRLPRLVGAQRALEISLTGDAISAEDALEIGLVNRAVPDHELIDVALLWARRLAAQAPLAVEQIKRVLGRGDLDAGLEAEKDAFLTAFTSRDASEGFSAFLEKREASWSGA